MKYTVSYKDQDGRQHNLTVTASSASAALRLVLDEYAILKAHPNWVYKVSKEE